MRRPWNIPDEPVYSLATWQGDKVNMNICTYVTPISMKPKQYAVAVYKDTKTLENLLAGSGTVLQLLHQSQANLIQSLGKRSGKKTDKAAYLQRKKILTDWKGYEVLTDALAWIEMEVIDHIDTGGDHFLFYFRVLKSKTNNESPCLSLQYLIRKGLIL